MTMKLRALRARQKDGGFPGEPGVLLPTDKVGVIERNGKRELFITIQDLAEYIDELENQPH